MKTNTMTLNGHEVRFFHNGIKIDGGKLIRGWFSHHAAWSNELNSRPEHVMFYERDYYHEGLGVFTVFDDVKNDSDSQTDYFETTSATFRVDSPVFAMAKAMADKKAERFQKQQAIWRAKRGIVTVAA